MADQPDAATGIPETVLEELYGTVPEEFVTRRTALAKELRAAGDKAAATAVAAVRKPSPAAWIVNQLAHDRRRLAPLHELAQEIAAAMGDGDAARIRELAAAQRVLVSDLVEHGSRLLQEATGRSATAAVQEQLADAVRAVVADPPAAAGLLSGRLTEIPAGDDDLVTGGLVFSAAAAPDPAPRQPSRPQPSRPQPSRSGRPTTRDAAPDEPAATARRAARTPPRVDREAERRREITRAANTADRELARADRTLQQVRERIAALRDQLVSLESEQREAEKARRDADLVARRAHRRLAAFDR